MQLKWLEDFIELVRTRSLSHAAETRCVTPPAFGRRIRALEDWVGAPWDGTQSCSGAGHRSTLW